MSLLLSLDTCSAKKKATLLVYPALKRKTCATYATFGRQVNKIYSYLFYGLACRLLKIDAADKKEMMMNSLEGLKLVIWKIDYSEFVEIFAKFSENCHCLNTPF